MIFPDHWKNSAWYLVLETDDHLVHTFDHDHVVASDVHFVQGLLKLGPAFVCLLGWHLPHSTIRSQALKTSTDPSA